MKKYEYRLTDAWYDDIASTIMQMQDIGWEYLEMTDSPIMKMHGRGLLFRRRIK